MVNMKMVSLYFCGRCRLCFCCRCFCFSCQLQETKWERLFSLKVWRIDAAVKGGGVPAPPTTAYYCILLRITAFYCIPMHSTDTSAVKGAGAPLILLHSTTFFWHYCILLHTTGYCKAAGEPTTAYCILLHPIASYCILLHTGATKGKGVPVSACILQHISAFCCVLLEVWHYCSQLSRCAPWCQHISSCCTLLHATVWAIHACIYDVAF